MAKKQTQPEIKEEAQIPDLFVDLNKQYSEIMKHFLFPPFTVRSNMEKVLKLEKEIRKVYHQKMKRVQQEKEQSVNNSFAPILADYSSMFKESRSWMDKSGGDYMSAAEMYRGQPNYKAGDLVPPLYQSPGWVA